ncbi:phage tail length tape measure family protein [Paracoccus sp. TOH]|uniref:phage tail length tape measure family protein n=1 Tax=Paracoccus sp. TOH TaxID=1263728 RepID=UPI0025B1EAE7|nr:phage tail length tape measure family protein [Paracoccus sp. TOH]WJS86700.1 phage tail length tape measure family protein [Paracoccus sp. TOH]
MATNVGVLKATLGLDAAGFTAGIGKAKTEITGLKDTAASARRDLRSAAGANANLVSQFNDIGVMLAAGQNPLQLALQQGTQISQVLTQMGGGVGALRALGSAFVGMINPVSLATIGVIGFGAAAVQWLMPAQDEAKKTKDAFEALKDSMSTYNDALSVALLYTGEAEKQYGEEARRGAEIARRIMMIEAEKTRSSISSILSKAYSDMGFDALGDRGIDAAGRIASANLAEAAGKLGFKSSWSDTLFGVGGISQENLALAEKLGNTMRDIHAYVSQPVPEGGLDDYLTTLRLHLDDYTAQLNALKDAGAGESALNAINEQMIPLQRALLEGEAKRAEIRAADAAKAAELLATMESQLYMNQLIAEYGKESLEVRQAELDAEYDKQVAAIEALNITDEQKVALYDALDALHANESQTLAWADAMAQVNAELQGAYSLISAIGGGMIMNAKINAAKAVREAGGSALEARRAGEIAGRKQEILNARNTFGSEYFGMTDAELQGHLDQVEIDANLQDEWSGLITEPRRARGSKDRRKGSGRSRRGSGMQFENRFERTVFDIQQETQALLAQAKALEGVGFAGADWERQLAVIQEEQKLLTEAQKSGVNLTPEVKASIRQMAEEYAGAELKLKKLREQQDEFAQRQEDVKSSMKGAFSDWISGAASFSEALGGVIAKLAEMAASAAFEALWQGFGGDVISSAVAGFLSFDGGGNTGNGARSGGLDGKGGFLAMLHPQESVIDHTKGGFGLGGHMSIGFDKSTGDLTATMYDIAGNVVAGARQGIVRDSVRSVGAMNRKTKSFLG